MSSDTGSKVLVRSREGRMVAGVCSGLARYFGWDVTMVRVIVAVLCIITGGAGALAYLAVWVLIPEEGEKSSLAEELIGKSQHSSSG
ncbi:MAG: PspC domain-containing protein [Streptosporangiaceae bacterium]